MEIHPDAVVERLEDLPNIGKIIAADLRETGIHTPAEFARVSPIELYHRMKPVMGGRHDPCVLHTFLAVEHFMKTAERLPWWKFTADGKRLLRDVH